MADTWIASSTAISFSASSKVFLELYNTTGSGVTIKVYRVWMHQMQASAITGVLPLMQLGISTSDYTTSASTITPIAYDTTNTALPAQVTCRTGATNAVSLATLFRRFYFSTEEIAISVTANYNIGTLTFRPIMSLVYDSGYNNSLLEPITLNANEGLVLYCAGIASPTGTVDVQFEFTVT